MSERLKPTRRKAESFALGYRVPVIVIYKNGSCESRWCGDQVTVSALNTRREHMFGENLPRGLFLNGPRHDDGKIAKVLAVVKDKTGEIARARVVDVTDKIKMSYGPAL